MCEEDERGERDKVCEGDEGYWPEYRVVHIVPGEPDGDGVKDVIKMEAVEAFFAHDRAIKGGVMRIRDDSMAVAGAAKSAKRLARTGLAFDHDYDLDDTTRMYCTEFIWRIFEREGLDLTEGRRTKINLPGFRGDYIMPTDIAKNPALEPIYLF